MYVLFSKMNYESSYSSYYSDDMKPFELNIKIGILDSKIVYKPTNYKFTFISNLFNELKNGLKNELKNGLKNGQKQCISSER